MTSDQNESYPISSTTPAPLSLPERPTSPIPVTSEGYIHSYSQRLSHASPSEKHQSSAALLSCCSQPPHSQSVVTEQTGDSTTETGSIIPRALPHFRDDVWTKPPLPAENQDHIHAPSSQSARMQDDWLDPLHKEDHVMGYCESPVTRTTDGAASSLYGHRYVSGNNNATTLHTGSVVSSPYYQPQAQRRVSQDVPSAPFANAGPPGVGAQFYATPEVHQVQMQMPVGYSNTYSSYCSTPITGNSAYFRGTIEGGTVANQINSASKNTRILPVPSASHTYVYGVHSTNNSPYHSASSGLYRYGYYGQASSACYRKY